MPEAVIVSTARTPIGRAYPAADDHDIGAGRQGLVGCYGIDARRHDASLPDVGRVSEA